MKSIRIPPTLALSQYAFSVVRATTLPTKPNILFIMTDDFGCGDLFGTE